MLWKFRAQTHSLFVDSLYTMFPDVFMKYKMMIGFCYTGQYENCKRGLERK